MYKHNTKFSQMRDKRPVMKNSGKINKARFNPGGNYGRGANNRGQTNQSISNQPYMLHDVTKLKRLCTATNDWIQQKSSELLQVLKRSNNKGGETSHRTVTIQPKANFGPNPHGIYDRGYNDFQQDRNFSGASNLNLNTSQPANRYYEQNREHNQEERNWAFDSNQDVPMKQSGYQSKPKSNLYSIIENMKLYLKDKHFSENNAAKLFSDAIHSSGGMFSINSTLEDNQKQHTSYLKIENVLIASGTSSVKGVSRSVAKRTARGKAFTKAINRIKSSSPAEICDEPSARRPGMMNKLLYQAIIKPDEMRPISTLVIRETQKMTLRRQKNAMSILTRSVHLSKMIMNKITSVVGNVHKVTILVQNKPVGIGFGSSMTKATSNAAADALFNNLYRKHPVIQVLGEEDDNFIDWTNIKIIANEMERIGGHSLISGQNISNRAFATAIIKLVETHPWNEVNDEMVFGPGLSQECVRILTSIAKERNLSLEEKKRPQFGTYYTLQRYYDPVNVVSYLGKNGGKRGRYRLVPKSEILQIQCDHWEPTSQFWDKEKESKEDLELETSRKQRLPHFAKEGDRDRNFDNSSGHVGRGFKNEPFINKPRMANEDEQFHQMSHYREDNFDGSRHSKDKYLMPNNDGKFNQKFARDKELPGFNDGDFRQMSRSENEFRQMPESFDREPKQMSWPEDRGVEQRYQHDGEEYEQSRWLNNREFRQGHLSSEGEIGQRQWPDREFRQMNRPNNEESKQINWDDRKAFDQTFWPHDKELNRMTGSHDRELRDAPQNNSREFRRMQNLEEQEFNQMSGRVERGMSNNFDREFRSDKNQRPGHNERRFDSMYDCPPQEFNRISDNNERPFNPQFHSNENNKEQMHHSYNENYKQFSDANKERMGRNPFENHPDKSSRPSDMGFHHSSNFDNRFNFDNQGSDLENRRYNQLMSQNKRNYDNTSCDDRLYTPGPNFDDRKACIDRQNNDDNINRDMMNPNRIQNDGPWNKMQNPRNDDCRIAENSRIFGPNNQMACVPPQANILMQNIRLNQESSKSQMMALQFLTKKIAHTALHANVKSILANARRLSNIAKERSRVEKFTGPKPLLSMKLGKEKITRKNFNQPKAAASGLQISQISKSIKRNRRLPAFSKSTKGVSSQNKDAKDKSSKGGNNSQKN